MYVNLTKSKDKTNNNNETSYTCTGLSEAVDCTTPRERELHDVLYNSSLRHKVTVVPYFQSRLLNYILHQKIQEHLLDESVL